MIKPVLFLIQKDSKPYPVYKEKAAASLNSKLKIKVDSESICV
jgi:hypothetical protein